MNWNELIISVLGGGGILYLVVDKVLDKIFSRRQDNANVKTTTISNGSDLAKLYKEVDEIVQSKTAPIEEKLDKALAELDTLKTHWCCYRKDCDRRVIYDPTRDAEDGQV